MTKVRSIWVLLAVMGMAALLAGCGNQTPTADSSPENSDPAALRTSDVTPPPTSEVDVYFGLLEEASAAIGNGEYDDAMGAYMAALAMAKVREDPAGQSSIRRRIGVVYYLQGRMDEALDEYWLAVELARAVKAYALEGNALRNIGIIYFDRHEYDEAIEYYNQALAAAQQPNARERDPALEGDVLFSLGKAFHLNGDLSLALQNYERAASIYHQLEILQLHGSVLRNIGIVYDMQGYNEAALTYYEQAMEIARQIEDAEFEDDLAERIQGLSE